MVRSRTPFDACQMPFQVKPRESMHHMRSHSELLDVLHHIHFTFLQHYSDPLRDDVGSVRPHGKLFLRSSFLHKLQDIVPIEREGE